MRRGFYLKLAWNNLGKNYRFFIPRILAETGLLACFYIALTLALDDRLADIKGGAYIPTFMWMGVAILGLLSAVLMLYINSFLMKQRKREFGLYNVLGMEKKHIGRVLCCESVLAGGVSVLCGLGLGILFYKLCSLLICRLLKADVILGFYFISAGTLVPAGLAFLLLDAVIYFFNRAGIARLKPVELLASRQIGEKEPKVKWVLLALGVLTLGGGYYISLTTKSPLQALGLFFLAVILVILGTYFLFVSGSIFVLKALKKNKKYYYTGRHMPSVSGLLYRMKQNAVGLASIAILATGVLVMVSTTVSLYSGVEGTLRKNYPDDFYAEAYLDGKPVSAEELKPLLLGAAEKNGLTLKSVTENEYLTVGYYGKNNVFLTESEAEEGIPYSEVMNGLVNMIFITEDTYEKLTGNTLNLQGREIAACRISSPVSDTHDLTGTVTFHGLEYPVKEVLYFYPVDIPVVASGFTTYGIVVSGDAAMDELYENQRTALGDNASDYIRRINASFTDRDLACERGEAFQDDFADGLRAFLNTERESEYSWRFDSFWEARENMVGMFGSLLFLGILLGAVCLFATVLIIYYKQISEGYEDRERFRIMEKIGMSRQEVRKTINSQVLLVFFLPLLAAGIHLAFAFPMLNGMLKILMLYDRRLLLVCTLITYAVFALVYVLIYKATSRTYYKIVR